MKISGIKLGIFLVLFVGLVAFIAVEKQTKSNFVSTTKEKGKIMDLSNTQTAYFAAGCFWGVQAAYDMVPGVITTTTGYIGGNTQNPTYRQVCSGNTNHTEAVEVVYDPNKVSFDKLLKVFFLIHDPTQINRQANDYGTQYRSAIFYTTDQQREITAKYIESLAASHIYNKPIATQVQPADTFYRAEDYHQKYLDNNPAGYCHINLSKLAQELKKI